MPVQVSALIKSSSAAVLAALSDQLGSHGYVQVSTLIKSSSATVLAASSDWLGPHGSVQVSTLIKSSSASTQADDNLYKNFSLKFKNLAQRAAIYAA